MYDPCFFDRNSQRVPIQSLVSRARISFLLMLLVFMCAWFLRWVFERIFFTKLFVYMASFLPKRKKNFFTEVVHAAWCRFGSLWVYH